MSFETTPRAVTISSPDDTLEALRSENAALRRSLAHAQQALRQQQQAAAAQIPVSTMATIATSLARLELLAQISQQLVLQSATDEAALQQVFGRLAEALGYELFFHFELGEQPQTLRLSASRGLTAAQCAQFATVRFGQYLCGQVAQSREALVAERLPHASYAEAATLCAVGVRCYVGIPLLVQNELLGTVAFATRQRETLSEGELQLIRTVCDQAAVQLARARSEQRLRASEAFNRHICEVAPCILYIFSLREQRNVWGNREMVDTLGYTREQIAAMGDKLLQNLLHPDDWATYAQHRERLFALADGDFAEFEYRMRHADGNWRWLHSRDMVFRRDADGQVQEIVGMALDITPRKQIEQQLREALSLLHAITDHSPNIIFAKDRDGRLLFVNPVIARYFGKTPQELIGKTEFDYLEEPAARAIQENDRRIMDSGITETVEEAVQVDGKPRLFLSTKVARRDAQGRVIGLIGIAHDITERKQMEDALRESELFYRQTLESIPGMVFTNAPDGHCDFVSEPWVEFTGATARAHYGDGWLQVVHPADRANAQAVWQAAVEGHGGFDLEYRVRRYDGQYEWFKVRSRAIRDSAGAVVRWFGTAVNIDNLKRVEAALRARERELKTLTDNTPNILARFDRNLRHVFVNAAIRRATGQPPSHFLGLSNRELGMPPELTELWENAVRSVFERQQPKSITFSFKAPDGLRFYTSEIVPEYDGEGRVAFALAVTYDVTEKKLAEEKVTRLLEEERRHALLLAQVAEASQQINSSLSVSEIARVLTDKARSIIGTHQCVVSLVQNEEWSEAVHVFSMSEKYDAYQSYSVKPEGKGIYAIVCRNNQPMRMTQAELEQHPAWKNFGDQRSQHPPMRGWLAVPLIGHGGRNLGAMQLSDKYQGEFNAEDEAILLQLAAIASTSIENAQLYASLREADRRKDEFLATLAHELRNPLAPIRTGLHVLKQVQNNGPQAARARDMMERQLSHMVRLVDDLLDVSRISRGKMALQCTRVELASILNNAAEACAPMIERHRHQLQLEMPAEPLVLHADAARLIQVFGNLLANACKYTPPGGKILISVRSEEGAAVVEVRDNGIGIPGEMLTRVFELFTQIDNSLERSSTGLGIGLALAKSLVELHEGRISAYSDGPGHGSRFTVRLPLLVEQAARRDSSGAAGALATAEELPRSRGFCILIVDDNADAAEMLALLLAAQGHQTHVAHDGLQAIASAERLRPDLLLLDLGMPRLNGYDACRRIRKSDWGRTLRIVALSGWGHENDRTRTREAGFDDHLVKPIDRAALLELLASLEHERAAS